MNKYELAVVVSAKLEDEARAEVIEKENLRIRDPENERRILLLHPLRG